jgi:hypothetical protein
MALRRGSWLQVTVLLALAAWLVHQGRYALAFGSGADRALAAQGHAYLGVLGAALAWAAAVSAARFVAALARRAEPRGRPWAFGRLWAASSGALIVVYCLQELAEGWLAAGHPAGAAAVLAAGGWWAFVLAVVLGALVALLIRGAHALHCLLAGRAPHLRRRAASVRRPAAVRLALPGVLAAHRAGRAPPRFLVSSST